LPIQPTHASSLQAARESLTAVLVLQGITAAAAEFSNCRPQKILFFLLFFLKNTERMPK
jgi:hypothetical protein